MKIDFWKDYDGKNGDDIPPLRVNVIKHSFHYSTWEYTGLEMVRIKAYAKACGIDLKTTPINAEFMNTMEEWYLNLAAAWQEIKNEIKLMDTSMVCEMMLKSKVLKIIDKHLQEQDCDPGCLLCMYYVTCDDHSGCSAYEAWY